MSMIFGLDRTATPPQQRAIGVNADGNLEITAELDSSGIATSANQTNGTQKAMCMGIKGDGNQQQMLVETNGSLVIGGGAVKTGADSLSNTTHLLTSTNGGLLCGNTVGDGSGTATSLKTASDGSLHIISENFDSMLIKGVETGTTTQRDCKQNSNGDLRSALVGNTVKDGTGDNYYLVCDADGKLETSGGGGGGSASSTQTASNANSSSGALKVYGSDNSTAFIDTNGGNKFIVAVQCLASSAGLLAVEWSDTSSFTEFFVCNGFTPLGADVGPKSLTTGVTRVDSSTVRNQALFQYETIPARYARVTVFQSVGTVEYFVKTYLSP